MLDLSLDAFAIFVASDKKESFLSRFLSNFHFLVKINERREKFTFNVRIMHNPMKNSSFLPQNNEMIKMLIPIRRELTEKLFGNLIVGAKNFYFELQISRPASCVYDHNGWASGEVKHWSSHKISCMVMTGLKFFPVFPRLRLLSLSCLRFG